MEGENEGNFTIKGEEPISLGTFAIKEIIGNIYENPELLEGEK